MPTPTDEALSDCREWQERHRYERLLRDIKTPAQFFNTLTNLAEVREAALHAAIDAHFRGGE